MKKARDAPFSFFAVQSDHPGPAAAPPVFTMTKPPKIPESVLVVIHTAALDVLILKRADQPEFWQSVTGSKDALDEPLAETAAREVAEETGLVLGSPGIPPAALLDWRQQIEYAIYPQYLHRYAPGVTRNVEHWFSLEVPAGADVTLAPREHTDFLWLPYRDAAARCFSPSNADAILQLPARLATRHA
jgi:dihydroneopterin triphosphate diphosphatase